MVGVSFRDMNISIRAMENLFEDIKTFVGGMVILFRDVEILFGAFDKRTLYDRSKLPLKRMKSIRSVCVTGVCSL